MDARLAQLEERLARAEAEVRAMRRIARWLGGAAVAVVAGVLVFGATRPAASQLEALTALKRGTRIKAPLTVTDRRGRPLMQVVDTDQARGIMVFDPGGNLISGVGQTAEGRGVAVVDSAGRKVLGLGVSAGGQGLTVFDTGGQTATWIGIGNPGPTQGRGMLVSDETGAHVARVGVVDQPDQGTVILQDRSGTVLFQQP